MSIYGASLSFLAIKPKVWTDRNVLYARTSGFVQLLSLFSYKKLVRVDPRLKRVIIKKRHLWCIPSTKAIRFERIESIGYGYKSMSRAWSFWSGTTDEIEIYTVALVLSQPSETVILFKFTGEGAAMTGWSGVLLGDDDIVDYSGDQEKKSLGYVEMLQEAIGVELSRI